MFLTGFDSVLETMLFTGFAGLCIAAVFYFAFWLFTKKKFPASISTHVLRYVFLTYCLCVVLLTWTSQGEVNLGANFVPLSSVFFAVRSGFETAQILILLNIFMFVPMGLFLPLVFSKIDKLWKAILICFGATLLIETVQSLLPGRAFDIDDVIMNTLGGAIGFSLYTVLQWIRKDKTQTIFTKIAAISVLLFIPAFLGVFSFVDAKEFRYGFTYRLHLPEEIELIEQNVTYPQVAPVYTQDKVDAHALLTELQAKFGIVGDVEDNGNSLTCLSGDKRLHIFTEAADWRYTVYETTGLTTDLPDDALIAQAKSFLQQYDLWDDNYILEFVADNEVDTRMDVNGEDAALAYDNETMPDYIQVTERAVCFSMQTTKKTSTATVRFDSKGICEIDMAAQTYTVYKEVPLAAPIQALNALSRSGRCSIYMAEPFFEPQSSTLIKASLEYVYSMDQQYKLPAWRVEGIFYGKDHSGKPIETQGYILVEAIWQ